MTIYVGPEAFVCKTLSTPSGSTVEEFTVAGHLGYAGALTLTARNTLPDGNASDDTRSVTLTPQLPATCLERYDTQRWWVHTAGSATLGSIDPALFVVTAGGFETGGPMRVLSRSAWITHDFAPALSWPLVMATPHQTPVRQLDLGGAVGAFSSVNWGTDTYVETAKSRVNPALCNLITWTDLDVAVAADGKLWSYKNPDSWSNSSHASVATFVANTLGANPRAYPPFDAAQRLYVAVREWIDYTAPSPVTYATEILTGPHAHQADCGGYAALFIAALRHIGIPARFYSGAWGEGTDLAHVLAELYLPGAGWISADGIFFDDSDDHLPLYFGNIPYNNMIAVQRAVKYGSAATYFEGWLQGPHLKSDAPVAYSSGFTHIQAVDRCDGAATGEQRFSDTMSGCTGAVTRGTEAALCGPGRHVCTAKEWQGRRGSAAPTHNYWVADDLGYSGTSSDCSAEPVGPGVGSCFGNPMRVCSPTQPDAEGNVCNWRNCSLGDDPDNAYFGGCLQNTTAGALCCDAGGCSAQAVAEQEFSSNMYGCAGSKEFSAKADLCAPGFHVCTAGEWMINRGAEVPEHNYWTADNLGYAGTPGDCRARALTNGGTSCGASPMRVCSPTQSDPEGNQCNWTSCKLEHGTTNAHFGGCVGNTRAGTLCCRD